MKSIESLRYFITTVKQGSFSAAAEQLNVAVSSISRHVQQLEKEFNSQLLIRHTRRLSLTETGQHVYRQGMVICAQLDQLAEEVALHQQRVQGHVKISAPLWYGTHYIAPLLPVLQQQWPQLTIYLNYGEEALDPYGADYDIYIRIEDYSDSAFIARPLQHIEYWACASADYLATAAAIHQPVDLKQHQLLAQNFRNISTQWYFEQTQPDIKTKQKIELNSAWLSSNSSLALLEAALQNGGVVLLPHHMVITAINEKKLIRILNQYTVSPFNTAHSMALVYTKDKTQDLKTKVVIDHLLSQLGQ
ncbi:LysR family transcriptional regulator [Photobacterium phosphoreum]|uniref:LysR family transcriptional regulator n=1 Tax=Photobacterium phosphoreum TaxID=659 RepID=UPI001E414C03|nr:LysR family transcriptional regulator [Photobacterium phosphoreum]MCD9510902.1 LysR family transcriptional regulator [Photobacterium phosphoreum]